MSAGFRPLDAGQGCPGDCPGRCLCDDGWPEPCGTCSGYGCPECEPVDDWHDGKPTVTAADVSTWGQP
jgi:hypothetical protein